MEIESIINRNQIKSNQIKGKCSPIYNPGIPAYTREVHRILRYTVIALNQ